MTAKKKTALIATATIAAIVIASLALSSAFQAADRKAAEDALAGRVDEALAYIGYAQSRYDDPDARGLNGLDRIADFLEDDLFVQSMFDVRFDGDSEGVSRAYIISPDGTRIVCREPWFIAGYIGDHAEVGSDYIIGGTRESLCIPVKAGKERESFGTLTAYDLYPVKDLCLSSAGPIETAYDPARVPAFGFFARTLAGRLDQSPAAEGG